MTLEEIFAGESKNLEFNVQHPKVCSKYMKFVVVFANGSVLIGCHKGEKESRLLREQFP